MNITEALTALTNGEDLSRHQTKAVFDLIMTGEATPAQIGGVLMALRTKGESVAEIAGAAMAMREASLKVSVEVEHLVDTCGTGGSGAHKLFNVSTAAAFVAAAGGAHVAKHGNRAATSKSGSADVLEEAGVNLDLSAAQVGRCIEEVGIGFLFAMAHHPAMRFAGPVRRELGVRTVFNVLGPLTNPASAKRQVLGVFTTELQRPLAQVLAQLGAEHVLVVHANGLDELTIGGTSHIVELRDDRIEEYTVVPADFGMDEQDVTALKCDSPEASLRLIRSALAGDDNQAASDLVAMNAGAALYAAGVAGSLANGVAMAQDLIITGQAAEKFKEFVALTKAMAAT
ncbi:MAG: anthranilate phosphoribosyltransferase [Gammaproteobacteria bacterium]|nr:anthranilate phosphoribosyltransferase [Gammaproteobacteria bacterium]